MARRVIAEERPETVAAPDSIEDGEEEALGLAPLDLDDDLLDDEDDDDDFDDEDELPVGVCERCGEDIYSDEGPHIVPGPTPEERTMFHNRCHNDKIRHERAVAKSKRRYARRIRRRGGSGVSNV